MTPGTGSSPGLRPFLFLVVASCLIPLGDAIAKYGHAIHGMPVEFLAWSRFTLGALGILPFALFAGMRARHVFAGPALLRGALIAATVWLILQAAARAPLADVYGAFFVAPVLSFVLAVVWLRERPGPVRSGLVFLGFLGVLLVTKPASGFRPAWVLRWRPGSPTASS